MPIRKIKRKNTVLYKFGNSGKAYKSRKKAIKQMKAIFSNGYKGSDKDGV